MNNQEIVNYVMNTPSNTNRAILNQMLDDRDVSWMEFYSGNTTMGMGFGILPDGSLRY